MRPSPNPSRGHGESDCSHSVADCIELAPVALELLPLGVDNVGGGVLDEALVGELLLGALDLLREPCALGVDVAVLLPGRALRSDDGVEDAPLLALELRQDARAAEHLRRLL